MKKISVKEKEAINLILSDGSMASYYFERAKNDKFFNMFDKKKYFSPSNNPLPKEVKNGFIIPQWNVLPYLEMISSKYRKYDNKLIRFIEETTFCKNKEVSPDNYRTWWYFTKILLNIPLLKIPKELIEKAIPIWLISKFSTTLQGADIVKKLLPKYLVDAKNKESIKKVESLIKIVLSIKFIKEKNIFGEREKAETLIEDYWLEEAFLKESLAKTIGEKCTNEPIIYLVNKLKEIFSRRKTKGIKDSNKEFAEDYSYIWIKNLSKDSNKSIYSTEHLFSLILRDIVLSKAKTNEKEGEKIIQLLFDKSNPHFIFKRIVLYSIAEEWNKYNKYFKNILTPKGRLYFNIGQIENELSYLITKNIDKAPEIRKKIINIIELGPTNIPPNISDKGKKEEYINYWKQAWYLRLKSDKEFNDLYEHYKKKTGKDIKTYDEESQWIDFKKSPVSKVDLITWENKKVVKYIHEYKVKDPFHSPTGEGLQNTLKGAVIDNPNKFSNDLDPFLEIKNISFYTLSSMFDGFRQAWISKKQIDWEKILNAILIILNNDNFWKKGKEASGNRFTEGFTWCLSSIGELIQEGCKTDEWAFDEIYHKKIEEIIEKIILKFDDQQTYEDRDQLTHALNSVLGKTTIALIYLGLREARLSDKRNEKKESKWNEKLRETYEKVLVNKVYDSYALLGQYLANIHYIDKNWVVKKIKEIESTDESTIFEAFFEGYLYINNVYNELYKLLRNSYERALKINFKKNELEGRLIDHLTTGYLRGFEKLGEGLLKNEFIFDNPKKLENMISFLWQQRDFINEIKADDKDEIKKIKLDFKERIITFWEYVIKLYKDNKHHKEEDQKVLSELSKLTVYCYEISKKEFELIKISAPYVTVGFDSSFFIESLNALKDKGENKIQSAKYVAQLYILMLEGSKKYKGDLPDFDWKDIEQIISYLYSLGKDVKELTNKICVLYAESGNLMLRDLYEENNK